MVITEAIDIEEYLQARGIPYSNSNSKNVGKNSIGISCPFCGDHQYSGNNHLGIKLDTKQWNCWICGAGKSKHLLSLIVELENCSYQQAEEILKPFTHSDLVSIYGRHQEPIQLKSKLVLPKECKNELLRPHRKYLGSRGFDPDYIFYKYKLKSVGPISKRWKLSLIAPIFYNHRMVSFISADVTRERAEKYKNLPIDESVIPINDTIYNLDNAKNSVLVVEGITDVWNIGDSCVGLYTKRATLQQLKILSEFDRVFIMLDSDTNKPLTLNMLPPSEQLAQDLSAFTNTEIIELDYGDPADLKEDDVRSLRRELFGS